jgi:hypothetical protein
VLAALKSMGLMGWILNLEADTHGLAALGQVCRLSHEQGTLSIIMYPDVDVLYLLGRTSAGWLD